MGTQHSVTSGRFQEGKFHRPLFGNESWKATVASVPIGDSRGKWKQTFAANPESKKLPFAMSPHYLNTTAKVLWAAIGAALRLLGEHRMSTPMVVAEYIDHVLDNVLVEENAMAKRKDPETAATH